MPAQWCNMQAACSALSLLYSHLLLETLLSSFLSSFSLQCIILYQVREVHSDQHFLCHVSAWSGELIFSLADFRHLCDCAAWILVFLSNLWSLYGSAYEPLNTVSSLTGSSSCMSDSISSKLRATYLVGRYSSRSLS